MKKISIYSIAIAVISLVALPSQGAYLYQSFFQSKGQSYTKLLRGMETDVFSELPGSQQKYCQMRYNSLLKDRALDIRIALGYFDWTTGHPIQLNGRSYGYSPSIDIGAFAALRDLLTAPCSGRLHFCGFKTDPDNPYVFRRQTTIRGVTYPVRLEMHFSSSTEILQNNLRSRSQEQRSQYTEDFFLRGLQSADAIFYFGHARNGGGPDFEPPVFISGTHRVNYKGYYQSQRPGFKKMIKALNNSSHPAPIIGLMSCNARSKFLNPTRAAAPRSGVITSTNVLDVDIVYTAMIGAVDAMLRGQCQRRFYQSLRLTDKNRRYITMDGMFE